MATSDEIKTIAGLLRDLPSTWELNINAEWFELETMQNIMRTIQRLEGQDVTADDILQQVNINHPMQPITYDEWQMILDSNHTTQLNEFMVNRVHKAWVDRQIEAQSKKVSLQPTADNLERIESLLEERRALLTAKASGKPNSEIKLFEERLNSEESNIKTFGMLDDLIGGGISAGQLVVIGARPAVGKTAMGLNMMLKVLERNQGVHADFFSLEMDMQQIMRRLISNKARLDSQLMKKTSALTLENKRKALETYREIGEMDLNIYGADYAQLGDIILRIKKNAKADKYVAFVDYAGLIGVKDGRKNERQALNEVTRKLKLLTIELKIPIVLFAQLNRGIEGRQNKRPTMADLKESGSLEQDANIVMLLSHEEDDRKDLIRCEIAKNREGLTGVVPFKFNAQYMDFDCDYNRRA